MSLSTSNDMSVRRQSDVFRLQQAFAAAYDASILEQAWLAISENAGKRLPEFLGEGTHFRAFRIPGRNHLDLCLKIPNPRFLEMSGAQLHTWQTSITQLGARPFLLFPSARILRSAAGFALVMPLGSRLDENTLPDHWLPLQELEHATAQHLAQQHRQIADHWQVRHWQNIPFLIDLSDLKKY